MSRALERATADKLAGIEAVAAAGTGPAGPELRELADEANRLNETCRIYVNLMAANVRRRLQTLTGDAAGTAGYRLRVGVRTRSPAPSPPFPATRGSWGCGSIR